jgi:putative PIN family toxin of toxin-antitoxin system
MRIVLDTNCLLPSIFESSRYYWLWEGFCDGKFSLCCTTEILNEYAELLSIFYSPEISDSIMESIMNAINLEQIIPHYKWNLISADLDDNKFVDCALNAGADFIVSNDKHFNILKKIDFPKINVIGIKEFAKILND